MNITTLTTELHEVIKDLKSGKLDRATADTLINGYGKIGSNARNQVAYLSLRSSNPSADKIDFYESGLTKVDSKP